MLFKLTENLLGWLFFFLAFFLVSDFLEFKVFMFRVFICSSVLCYAFFFLASGMKLFFSGTEYELDDFVSI